MITQRELEDAIWRLENAEDPTAQTCITLSAFYNVKDHMYPDSGASFDAEPTYSSDTEFGQTVQNKKITEILALMDELLETLKVLHPPLYESVMIKLGGT